MLRPLQTTADIFRKRDSLYEKATRRYRDRMRSAHPETDGNHLLVHNWGNPEARHWLERHSAVTGRIWPAFKRAFDAAEHRQNHGPDKNFVPSWCDICQGRH